MLAAPVVLVALLLSAETIALDAPARGSVNGPWALVDLSFLGATSVPRYTASSPAILGGQLALNGGLGFQVGSVRFSPTR